MIEKDGVWISLLNKNDRIKTWVLFFWKNMSIIIKQEKL